MGEIKGSSTDWGKIKFGGMKADCIQSIFVQYKRSVPHGCTLLWQLCIFITTGIHLFTLS